MRYHIERQGQDVVISFRQLGGEAQAVIDAIGRCRQGAANCSSGECMKIAGMEASVRGDELAVRLTPRDEAALSIAGLGECLKYQLPGKMPA
jgi:hypothetical protein